MVRDMDMVLKRTLMAKFMKENITMASSMERVGLFIKTKKFIWVIGSKVSGTVLVSLI